MIDARAASWVDRATSPSAPVSTWLPSAGAARTSPPAADVYAATITLVEMLVGEPPYWEDSQLLALRSGTSRKTSRPTAIPVELRDIVRLGLAKDAVTGARRSRSWSW